MMTNVIEYSERIKQMNNDSEVKRDEAIDNHERKIPNKAFDLEYSTQRKKEYLFLKEAGIYPSFVRKDREYGILTYKYTKTPKLFKACAEFYQQAANEKARDEVREAASVESRYQNVQIV